MRPGIHFYSWVPSDRGSAWFLDFLRYQQFLGCLWSLVHNDNLSVCGPFIMTGPQAVSCHASSSLGFPVVHSIAHNDYLVQLSVCQLPPVACSMGSKVKHNNWTHAEGGPRDEAVLALYMCPYHHTSSEKLFTRS